MKKVLISILTCAVTVALCTISFGATGVVNTDNARLRAGASSDSSVMDVLSINEKVEVLEQSGDWYKVKAGDQTGYVSKSLLDVNDDVEKAEASEENTTSKNEVEETTTNTSKEETAKQETDSKTDSKSEAKLAESYVGNLSSEVTIKILPSINSTDIAKITKNTQITVVEIINEWCHIETTEFSGWARVNIVENALSSASTSEEEATTEEDSEEETTENKVGYVIVETVNVRKEANTSSEKLDSLDKNTEVTILGEEDGWYKIKVKDITGYISKEYISDKKVEEVTSRASDTARQILEGKEPSTTTTTVQSAGNTGTDVVAYAMQYKGYSYVSGGKSPSTGFDCSGFTSYVYKNFGVSLSASSSGQASAGTSVSKSDLQVGDLLIFNNSSNTSVGHVGIYIGNNQFIHAANASKGVVTTSLSDSYYQARYVDGRRVVQ